MWAGLGYYRRARYLLEVRNSYDAVFHVCTYLHSLVPCAAGYFLELFI